MAYVVSRPTGNWEVRHSVSTPAGPRSRTLASFRLLTSEVVELARERCGRQLDAQEIVAAARRAGAPVAREPALGAAATLIGELSRGARLPRSWERLLISLAGGPDGELTESERSGAGWADASAAERGSALRDLLLLADRIPLRDRGELDFPGFPRPVATP